MITIPSRNEKLTSIDGHLSTSWWLFFKNLTLSKPATETTLTVTASPYSFAATEKGNVLITGGTVSSVTLSRVNPVTGVTNTYSTGLTSGFFPVGFQDILKVTYTGLPTMVFFPS